MRKRLNNLFMLVSVFLSSGRQVSSLDLRLDIAGGTCESTRDFDLTFDYGVMPGTEEVMDITTTTLNDDAIRKYGYSAFRGDDISHIDFLMHTELPNGQEEEEEGHLRGRRQRRRQKEGEVDSTRDLLYFDCPVFKECAGAGDPTHWCAWICGYWQQPHVTSAASSGVYETSSTRTTESDSSTTISPLSGSETSSSSAEQEQHRRDDNGFLRRVTEDLRIPNDELEQLDLLPSSTSPQPIRYTPQDRKLWVSIEGLVCGWIQRWLDSELSECLHGATLVTCELELRS